MRWHGPISTIELAAALLQPYSTGAFAPFERRISWRDYPPLPEIRDGMLATTCSIIAESGRPSDSRCRRTAGGLAQAPLGSAWCQAGEVKR